MEVNEIKEEKITEEQVIEKSVTLTKMLWNLGYRQVDNSKHLPLQDGSK